MHALLKLSPEQKACGVVTRSSGNFAQALAMAGCVLGVAVTVVMPTTAPRVKVQGTERFKATVVAHGTTHAEGLARAQALVQETGAVFLPPFDNEDVMVGQGTCGLEVFEDLPQVKHFFAPIGGGGLMGGCALALKGCNPNIHVVGVEPEGANDFAQSLGRTQPVTLSAPHSMADGLLAPVVGRVNWPVLKQHVDDMVVVKEDDIARAMKMLYETLGLVVEPSGAVALAGFVATIKSAPLAGETVCVISGSNVDMARFESIVRSV